MLSTPQPLSSPSIILPAGWEMKRLDEVCRFKTDKPNWIDSTPTLYLPLENVDGRLGLINGFETRPFGEVKKYPAFGPGAVLFARISPALENGKCVIVPEIGGQTGFASTEFVTLFPNNEVTSKWVHAFLRRPSFRRQAATHLSTSASYRRIPVTWLPTVKIPVPPSRAIQQRIIRSLNDVLAEVDDCLEEVQRSQERLYHVFPAAMQKVFEELRKSAPSRPLNNRIESEALCSVVWGRNPSSNGISVIPSRFPYISGPSYFGARVPHSDRWIDSHDTICYPNDILLTIRGEGVGKMNLAPDQPMAIGRQIAALRPNRRYLLPTFLYYAVLAQKSHLRTLMLGVANRGIRKGDVENLLIPLPSISIQRQCAQYLESLEQEISSLIHDIQTQEQQLLQLKDDAFTQAFQGLI